MKKFISLLCFALLFVNVHAQKGYIKLRGSVTIGGSTSAIMKGMDEAGYNAKGVSNFFFGGSTDYPAKFKTPSIYIEGGIYIKEKRSISLLAGVEDAGDVDGQSYSSAGAHLHHKGYVLSPRINFHRRASLLGFGPALMLYNYSDVTNSTTPKGRKTLPGASITVETLFRGKRNCSMGVFSTLNLYTGSTIQIISSSATLGAGQQCTVNPSNLQAGLFFRYGK